ncbi:MAG: TetR/AcrR family transcriptional regulator [Pseudomonadota bacterium]
MEEKKSDALRRDDWVNAAYAAFESGGIQAVKADRLAKGLGITRGSFYWHFKNVADLMRAVLQKWKEQQTERVIASIEKTGGTAEDRLQRLLMLCAEDDGAFEVGIRNVMFRDERIAGTVAEIDELRMGYLANLLVEIGKPQAVAGQLAAVAYSAWLGEYARATGRSRAERIANSAVLFLSF